jgi:Na+/H+-dicarboxylate symporter
MTKMPFILVGLIVFISIFGHYIPVEIKSFIYSLSISIKSVIILLLPLIIFGLLFKVCVSLSRGATKLILFILMAVCVSNFTATVISGYVGSFIYNIEIPIFAPQNSASLDPSFILEGNSMIANDKAMFAGLLIGVLFSIFRPNLALIVAGYLDKIINKILFSFNFLIPVFVTGYILKLQHEGTILTIISNYALVFITIALLAISYLIVWYLVASNLKFSKFLFYIKNMLPACIVGFSTMSSAAAMPLVIEGAKRNSDNPQLAASIVPMVVNFHLLGCCLSIPIFAFAILKNYGLPQPEMSIFFVFTMYFVIAKFSVAAVPGGGIIVMLPILEKYLGFNIEMLSLITALYILFDPVITSINILGNGCFAVLMSKVKGNTEAMVGQV